MGYGRRARDQAAGGSRARRRPRQETPHTQQAGFGQSRRLSNEVTKIFCRYTRYLLLAHENLTQLLDGSQEPIIDDASANPELRDQYASR